MTACIVTFPGSNRERDMVMALTRAMGKAPAIVWHRETELPKTDLIVIPGGFAYGDYLRTGAIAAQSPIMRSVAERAAQGVLVLGVCNGFQILTETRLLPGALMRNAGLKFVCRDVNLRVERNDTAFTRGYKKNEVFTCPVAHHDGNYFADAETLARIEGQGQVAFRYCGPYTGIEPEWCPNGSLNNIAGVYNEKGNVLGLMPHPEDATEKLVGGLGGMPLFTGIAQSIHTGAAA
jgi:phosphoribosylformylglycinamidine synthase I